MNRVAKLCAMLFAAVLSAHAQVAPISGQVISQYGQPLPFATLRFCSVTSTGNPCTPTTPTYLDYALTIPTPSGYAADQYGNYTVYVPALASPNLYEVQVFPISGVAWTYVVAGPVTGGSGTGCVTTGTAALLISNGSGGCSTIPSDYNVTETNQLTLHAGVHFAMAGGNVALLSPGGTSELALNDSTFAVEVSNSATVSLEGGSMSLQALNGELNASATAGMNLTAGTGGLNINAGPIMDITTSGSFNLLATAHISLASADITNPGSGTIAVCINTSGDLTTTCPSGGSSAFSALTSGTNTTAAMLVGAGASLSFTSSGTINASSVGGVALAGLCQTGGSGCPQLPVTIGATAHQWINSYTSSSGLFTETQPTLADIAAGASPTGLFDFSGATALKMPIHTTATAAASGEIIYDSTNGNMHFNVSSTDLIFAGFPSGSLPTNGHCAQFTEISAWWEITDAGAPCSSGSGISGQTAGYAIEAATATTATGPFPMDDAITTAGFVTVHKNLQILGTGTANGFQVPGGTAIAGLASNCNLWSDSASNRWKQNCNNVGATIIPGETAAITPGHLWAAASNGIDMVDGGTGGSGTESAITISSGAITLVATSPSLNLNTVTFNASVTSITIANPTVVTTVCVDFVHDSSSTAYTVAWPSNMKGGFAPGSNANGENNQCFIGRPSSSKWIATSTGEINQ
jgi:hypothetical protein